MEIPTNLPDSERDKQIDEYLAKRGGRRIESPMTITLGMGVSLRLAEQMRVEGKMSDQEMAEAIAALPRNRAEARKLLKGRGPYGLARRG